MSATFRDIVTDAQEIMREVSGIGTQLYGEDAMFSHAKRASRMLLKRYPWEQYRGWSTHTLDGVNGIVSANAFTDVADFEDFLRITRDGEVEPLAVLAKTENPNTLGTGTRVLRFTSLPVTHASYVTRRLQFYPVTATDTINVLRRIMPAMADWDTTIYLDRDMLAHATAFVAMINDDLNPGAAEANKQLMDIRFGDIMAALAAHPRSTSTADDVPSEWSER